MNLKPIDLNLAGQVYHFAYNDDFSRIMFFAGYGWQLFDGITLLLKCGQELDREKILLTIKHKLGLI